MTATASMARPRQPQPINNTFFEREQELQCLRDVRHLIIEGQPILPAALVWGTSGSGKSTLVDQFLNHSCCTCGGKDQSKQPLPSQSAAAGARTELQGTIRQCSCCYVLRGKYDEYTGSKDPFAAIIQALDTFVTQLRHGPSDELQRIQHSVQRAFYRESVIDESGKDDISSSGMASRTGHNEARQGHSAMAALIEVVPSLSLLVSDSIASSFGVMTDTSRRSTRGDPRATSTNGMLDRTNGRSDKRTAEVDGRTNNNIAGEADSTAAATSSQSAWNRLCYVFIQFMKAISTPQRPVYLFLDDLQWSPAAGLELLASLLTDPDLRDFMLVGAIRQEINPHNHQAMELSTEAPMYKSFLERLSCADKATGSANSEGKRLEQITLGDLSLSDCIQWLSQLLNRSRDDSDLKLLVSKIHKKTHGNVYFTLQAIEALKRQSIIIYNHTSNRWEWTLPSRGKGKGKSKSSSNSNSGDHSSSSITNTNTDSSDSGSGSGSSTDLPIGDSSGNSTDLPIGDNTVAIIELQLKELPRDLQNALAIAAYIRSTFDLDMLQTVLQYVNDHGGLVLPHWSEGSPTDKTTSANLPTLEEDATAWTVERLLTVLEQALLEGLLTNSIGESEYHFAHDRVRQAASGLVPSGQLRNKLRLQIGHCILGMYRRAKTLQTRASIDDQLEANHAAADKEGTARNHDRHPATYVDSLLFIAAGHLSNMPSKDHLFLVTFNLEVGQRALQMAALSTADIYLRKSAAALQYVHDPWQQHYDTCLELFQCRSEMELSLGNFEVGYKLADEIIKRARTLNEKLPTHLIKAAALGREGKVAESLSLSLSIARDLGVFPRRFYLFHVVSDILWIKSYLKKHTDEYILNLPRLQDSRLIMAARIIGEIGARSFFAGESLLWLLHVLKRAHLELRCGLTDECAPLFAALGLVFSLSNEDRGLVIRCANLAHQLSRKVGKPDQASWVNVITAGSIYLSSEPFSKCIAMLKKGYSLAMEAGEFEVGLLNLQTCSTQAFFSGYKLHPLVETLENTLQQYKIYNVTFNNETPKSILMVTKYLAGAHPIDWNVIERNLQQDSKSDPSEMTRLMSTYTALSLMTALFGKHELVQRMTKLYEGLPDHSKNYCFEITVILVQGLSACALHRSTGKTKHKKELNRQINLARQLVTTRGRNATSLSQVLKAEKLSLKTAKTNTGIIRRTEEAYDLAIVLAEKLSFTHHCAIACENAAEYLIRVRQKLPRDTSDGRILALRASLRDSICRRISKAVQYYEEWGCSVKVEDIKERRARYLEISHEAQIQPDSSKQERRVVDMKIRSQGGFAAGTPVQGSSAPKWHVGLDTDDHITGANEEEADGDGKSPGDGNVSCNDDVSVLTDG